MSSSTNPPLPHGASHETGGTDDLYLISGGMTPIRIETFGRDVTTGTLSVPTGQVWFSHVTAPFALAITRLLVATWTTAGTLASLIRLGIYTVDASNNMTLVAQSADLHAATDATNAGAVYFQTGLRLWSCPITLDGAGAGIASYTMLRGQRYALAFIQVTAGVSCTLAGVSSLAVLTTLAPAIASVTYGGKTDLATSYTGASLTTTPNRIWMAVAP